MDIVLPTLDLRDGSEDKGMESSRGSYRLLRLPSGAGWLLTASFS
jgi:hypothetical protein